MKRKMVIEIGRGRVDIDMEGYKGDECKIDMKRLMEIIGGKTLWRKDKSETAKTKRSMSAKSG